MLCFTLLSALLLAQKSANSGTPQGVVEPSLAAPVDLAIQACGNDVELSWSDVSSAETAFVILRRDLPAASFQEVAVVAAGVTHYVDPLLANGVHVYALATRGTFQGGVRTSPPSERVRVRLPSAPPLITTDLPADLSNDFADTITFHVTVADPDGDPVSLRLLNPQPGMSFRPLLAAPSPATVEVRWNRAGNYQMQELPVRLVFESDCGVRLLHDVQPARISGGGSPVVVADVTGDGTLDALALGGSFFPPGPTAGVLVFAGSSAPVGNAVARLTVSGDDLSAFQHGLQCADLDGDGVLDVLAQGASGKLYFWRGGPSLSGLPAPTARLENGSPGTFSLVDLDGDGRLDVLQASLSATVGAATSAGRLFLWYGATSFTGVRSPDRSLVAPSPATNDLLGQQTLFADVTGDGELELLASAKQGVLVWDSVQLAAGNLAPRATLTPGSSSLDFHEVWVTDLSGDGVLDILRDNHLWHGGAGLSGVVPATTTLAGQPGVALSTVTIADLNGDSLLDALLTGPLGFHGHSNTGGFYLWAGGGATGTIPPSATLSAPDASDFDNLFNARIMDLDEDGTLDVLAYSIYVDGPGVEAGAMYVWYGGSGLSGSVAPAARLGLANTSLGAELTFYGVHVADLDGDGALDVAAAAPWFGPGAVHVFSGAGGFSGSEVPTVSLTYSNGTVPRVQELADVSGDGQVDLVVGTSVSRILVWRGGSGLFTATAPDALLTGPGQLGLNGFELFDVDENGVLDIVAATSTADLAVVDAGSIGIWKGGPALVGTRTADVTLSVAGARTGDRLGNDGLRFADWTGDGRVDLLAITPDADWSGSVDDSGALYLWNGANLTGTAVPSAFAEAITNYFLGRR